MPWKYVQYQNGQMRTTSDSGSSTLAGLTDTNISSPLANQFLTYNSSSSKWVNTTKSIPSNLNDLSDVNTSGVANNKVLGYNSSSSKWVPMTIDPGGNVDDVYVNGTTVVDDNKIAQIKSYKEVTQAEYEALPDTKLTDGVMYCIKDVGGADGFPPLIYSTEEREIGVWIDGKPIYQKVFEFSSTLSIPTNSWTATPVPNTEMEVIIKASGFNLTGTLFDFLGGARDSSDYVILLQTRSSTIEINKLILQYTKITDTPGSGTWTTQGAIAHHYSTDEHIIGTWIDGKPIYEKTFESTSGLINTSVTWDLTGLNIDKVISQTGNWCRKVTSSGDLVWYASDSLANPDFTYQCRIACGTTGYNTLYNTISIPSGNEVTYRYVILQYTKTTD